MGLLFSTDCGLAMILILNIGYVLVPELKGINSLRGRSLFTPENVCSCYWLRCCDTKVRDFVTEMNVRSGIQSCSKSQDGQALVAGLCRSSPIICAILTAC